MILNFWFSRISFGLSQIQLQRNEIKKTSKKKHNFKKRKTLKIIIWRLRFKFFFDYAHIISTLDGEKMMGWAKNRLSFEIKCSSSNFLLIVLHLQ